MSRKYTKIKNPYQSKQYKKEAISLAFSFCPTIYPCKDCGHPVVKGYCCQTCGSNVLLDIINGLLKDSIVPIETEMPLRR